MTLPGPWACYLLVNFRPPVTQFTRTPPIATPALREPSTRRCEAYGPESTLSPSSGNSVLATSDNFLMGDYIRRDEVALMLFARIPSIRPGPNPSVQRR